MTKARYALLGGLILATGAVGMAQDSTARPGQPTRARVWVQNHGDTEAVPVTIQAMEATAPPLRVEVVGGQSAAAAAGPIPVARPLWEYLGISVPPGQNPTTRLNAAGADGWEATGGAVLVPGGTLLLMKRPR